MWLQANLYQHIVIKKEIIYNETNQCHQIFECWCIFYVIVLAV